MLEFETLTVPLVTGSDNVIRVAGTRVRLDTVVFTFNQGSTPEEIVSQYPSLSLASVYAVIAYYLEHRLSVDNYIGHHNEEAAIIRKEIEEKPETQAFRNRILARRNDRR